MFISMSLYKVALSLFVAVAVARDQTIHTT